MGGLHFPEGGNDTTNLLWMAEQILRVKLGITPSRQQVIKLAKAFEIYGEQFNVQGEHEMAASFASAISGL